MFIEWSSSSVRSESEAEAESLRSSFIFTSDVNRLLRSKGEYSRRIRCTEYRLVIFDISLLRGLTGLLGTWADVAYRVRER